jgi:lipopolysaccharide/colanic/teichoic acid biosynthesis glycosyltransferase
MRNVIKRIFDIVVSSLAMLLLSPLFLAIGAAIKIGDKGPAIFKQERAGKNGKPFTLYKFRSMKINADPYGQSPTGGDDPRLIRGGKMLREYSLDELPQLYNVMKGDMSIIGPRPLYMSQVEAFSERHKRRLEVRPGITGLSQVHLRSELTSPESLDMEVEYVETHNLWKDIKIIFQTIAVVLGKKGVYEK